MSLRVPEVGPDDDVIRAAMAYAGAGWYVLPVRRAVKHAGSVLGKGWPARSSRDPEQIAAWFAGADHALALHAGRSGAVVFDVDDPAALPDVLAGVLEQARPPYQSTRDGAAGRGHHVFTCPPGRVLGNATGKLRGGWGEVRGRNGIVVVAPSEHEKAAAGGRYLWQRTGPVPVLPAALAELLPDALHADDAATDADVRAFLAAHRRNDRPAALNGPVRSFRRWVQGGQSRHISATDATVWALKEARAGFYPAAAAAEQIGAAFTAALNGDRPSEYAGILAWAVSQANAADVEEVRRVADRPDRRDDPADLIADPAVAPAPGRPAPRGPRLWRLDELLAEPDETVRYRIDRLWPVGGRVVLNAQWKAGKSTTVGNLVRSLVDDVPFLGAYPVAATGRRVVVIDDELDLRTIRRWYREQGIENTERVVIAPVRGQLDALDLLDPAALDWWAGTLRDLDAGQVLLDCLSPVLSALGLNENITAEVRRFLAAFDALLLRSGAGEGAVVHHAGHTGERGRGASGLRDWPDAEWLLVREQPEEIGVEPDPAAPRYFRAYGRDVNEPEQLLGYEESTRRLTVAGGSRAEARRNLPVADVVAVVTETPALTGNSVDARLERRGIPKKRATAARKEAVALGLVTIQPGPNRAQHHHPVAPVVPVVPGGSVPLNHHRVSGGSAPLGEPPPPPPLTPVETGEPPAAGEPPAEHAALPEDWPAEPPGPEWPDESPAGRCVACHRLLPRPGDPDAVLCPHCAALDELAEQASA